MNPLNSTRPVHQQAQGWSAHLGTLAAENAPARPASRLTALLAFLRRRQLDRQDAARSLRAHNFIRD
jgi:hypothetical protein